MARIESAFKIEAPVTLTWPANVLVAVVEVATILPTVSCGVPVAASLEPL